jgi:hypothetical protein
MLSVCQAARQVNSVDDKYDARNRPVYRVLDSIDAPTRDHALHPTGLYRKTISRRALAHGFRNKPAASAARLIPIMRFETKPGSPPGIAERGQAASSP